MRLIDEVGSEVDLPTLDFPRESVVA